MDESVTLEDIEQSEIQQIAQIPNADNIYAKEEEIPVLAEAKANTVRLFAILLGRFRPV